MIVMYALWRLRLSHVCLRHMTRCLLRLLRWTYPRWNPLIPLGLQPLQPLPLQESRNHNDPLLSCYMQHPKPQSPKALEAIALRQCNDGNGTNASGSVDVCVTPVAMEPRDSSDSSKRSARRPLQRASSRFVAPLVKRQRYDESRDRDVCRVSSNCCSVRIGPIGVD